MVSAHSEPSLHVVPTKIGPSRIRNKKRERLVRMIDGYDSVVTLGTVVAVVLLLWLIPALAMLGVGVVGMGADPDSISDLDRFSVLLNSVAAANSFYGVFTTVMFLIWAVRARQNVRRLGKRHRVGLWQIALRHLSGLAVVMFAIAIAFFVPSLAPIMVLVIIGAFVWVGLVVYMAVYAWVTMLWRTSSPPVGGEDALPHYGVVWMPAWIAFGALSGLLESPQDSIAMSARTVALVSIAQGLMCAVAAVTVAKLVYSISIRQDARLRVIIRHLESDDADGSTVTTDQIYSAWDASDSLVEFNQ